MKNQKVNEEEAQKSHKINISLTIIIEYFNGKN